MRIEWSELALDDLADIQRYIAKDSAYYGREFVERIFASADRLLDFPMSDRNVPETEDPHIRELIVQGYRVMYRLDDELILILAVMQCSRDGGYKSGKPWQA